jgi:hypothetical protein
MWSAWLCNSETTKDNPKITYRFPQFYPGCNIIMVLPTRIRTMVKLIVLPIATLALSSCSSTQIREDILGQWVGKHEGDLVSTWGVPQGVYETSERKFMEYSKRDSWTIPATEPTYITTYQGNQATSMPIGGMPAVTLDASCKTVFELNSSGYVVKYTYSDPPCLRSVPK